MLQKSIWKILCVLVFLLILTTPALAGGWAVVTLDKVPPEVRAGTPLSLGFMVRQHGQTPADWVTPFLVAHNRTTGESLRIQAHNEGAAGHFTVDVTFPSEGVWDWEISPEPLVGTVQFEPLTVLAPMPGQPAAQPAPAVSAPADPMASVRISLRWTAVALLLAALGTAALSLNRQRKVAKVGNW
ncbi:MAG: hypothetical protein AB1791_15975 [Chloroflexota bacterium]